jgi:hypothetical protein
VSSEFIAFLQGCGYQVTGDEVANYLTEAYAPLPKEPEWDFSQANAQFHQESMTGDVTLDGVIRDWACSASPIRT